jgi:NADP-dependent 3-hydroxy acid dehydrogenase YdfG
MNKVIILSGATKGLGLDIFNTLRPNYKIATISRNTDPFESQGCLKLKGDITNPADVKNFFNQIYMKWGEIDVLINNAGMLGEFQNITLYSEEEIDTILKTNIKGTFLMTQEAINMLRSPKGGLIINIGSTRSITGAPQKSLYTMTKFAMRGLTQCINAEYNIHNIYSTIICPGSFKTVDTKEIAKIIKHIIELPKESHIPEIIIGGQL